MRFSFFGTVLLLALLSCGCETDLVTGDSVNEDSGTEPSGVESGDVVDDAQALEALNLVNDIRAEGCQCGSRFFPPAGPLSLHPKLQVAAELHSKDQAARGNMSHVGSDGSRVSDRVTRSGFSWRNVGENVAWNQRSVAQVIAAWKGSTGHCENMMNPAYEFMGFAVQDWYWTQVLAR